MFSGAGFREKGEENRTKKLFFAVGGRGEEAGKCLDKKKNRANDDGKRHGSHPGCNRRIGKVLEFSYLTFPTLTGGPSSTIRRLEHRPRNRNICSQQRKHCCRTIRADDIVVRARGVVSRQKERFERFERGRGRGTGTGSRGASASRLRDRGIIHTFPTREESKKSWYFRLDCCFGHFILFGYRPL